MKNYENLGAHEWACRMGYKQIYYKYENLGTPKSVSQWVQNRFIQSVEA
jgi:hypothetical protein